MISKEEAKKEVKKLVELYEKYKASGDIKSFEGKEQNTKTTFILPLFKALGWDVHNEKSIEVVSEERVLKGAVDYAFRILGQNKFFVEAKPIGSELKEHVTQAIEYGVNSGNAWVVLTSFESIIIFNCEWKEKDWWKNALFGQLNYKDYLNNFDTLWLLSKESITSGGLDEWATRVGKKVPRTPIDKELLSKFLDWRLKLSKDISSKQKYSTEETDEFVQKLLIRLLFIKNCEDRDFETNYKLLPVIQAYKTHKKGVLKLLRRIFDYYDETYDSSIFENGEVDKISFDESLLSEILNGLHFTSDGLRYNFNVIPADVMGNLYEQYLGHILKKTPQRAKLKEGKAHRKEQGIYYTPTYIVDYIVKNTLGELLKNKKVDASKIRVLDPACGSGSFLVKAFDVLNEHYSKDKTYGYGQQTLAGYSIKEKILKNSIFGVDLDKQAAEIAQLNLLLRIAEKGQKLPLLQQNIKVGNSLIDDPSIAEKEKAFKWEEKFKDIIQYDAQCNLKEGKGFDVIIGNPPYGYRGIPTLEIKEAYGKKYVTTEGNFDMYRFFIERSINLLREGGRLGFIIPNTFLTAISYKKLRKYILDNCSIEEIVDVGLAVFEGVTVESTILLLEKNPVKNERNKQKVSISICRSRDKPITEPTSTYFISQLKFNETKDNNFNIYLDPKTSRITKRIENNSVSLEKIAYVTVGINTGYIKNVLVANKKVDSRYHKLLSGRDISRYFLKWHGQWILYDKKVVDSYGDKGRTLPDESIFKDDKVLVQRTRRGMARKLICTLDNEQYYNLNRLGNIVMRDKGFSLKYCLGILNSKLMDYYFQKTFNEYEVKPAHLRQLPIKQVTLSEQQPIIKLVDKMLSLNKRLSELGDKKTDERARIEEEIKKTDNEIDELVYKIYGITEEEKKIIGEALK